MLTAGCATKKYVQNTTAPIQAKVDQVGDQTTQNSQQIQDTKSQVGKVDERAQNGISAANEKAGTADQHASDAMNHANDAMTRATTADEKSDQNAQSLNKLREAIVNIDDYKLQTTVTVPFKLDKAVLTPETRQDLDKLAQDVQSDKRFFIAVEGYTDASGSRAYNESLSRKRADAVVEYLVAKHDIPIYRIHMIGLGVEKPVDDARTRSARAKNRRVEVKVFSADQVTGVLSDSSNSANRAEGAVTGH
jgi:outer membrane protein OmpA-like peptidoglycan-associated protein